MIITLIIGLMFICLVLSIEVLIYDREIYSIERWSRRSPTWGVMLKLMLTAEMLIYNTQLFSEGVLFAVSMGLNTYNFYCVSIHPVYHSVKKNTLVRLMLFLMIYTNYCLLTHGTLEKAYIGVVYAAYLTPVPLVIIMFWMRIRSQQIVTLEVPFENISSAEIYTEKLEAMRYVVKNYTKDDELKRILHGLLDMHHSDYTEGQRKRLNDLYASEDFQSYLKEDIKEFTRFIASRYISGIQR